MHCFLVCLFFFLGLGGSGFGAGAGASASLGATMLGALLSFLLACLLFFRLGGSEVRCGCCNIFWEQRSLVHLSSSFKACSGFFSSLADQGFGVVVR